MSIHSLTDRPSASAVRRPSHSSTASSSTSSSSHSQSQSSSPYPTAGASSSTGRRPRQNSSYSTYSNANGNANANASELGYDLASFTIAMPSSFRAEPVFASLSPSFAPSPSSHQSSYAPSPSPYAPSAFQPTASRQRPRPQMQMPSSYRPSGSALTSSSSSNSSSSSSLASSTQRAGGAKQVKETVRSKFPAPRLVPSERRSSPTYASPEQLARDMDALPVSSPSYPHSPHYPSATSPQSSYSAASVAQTGYPAANYPTAGAGRSRRMTLDELDELFVQPSSSQAQAQAQYSGNGGGNGNAPSVPSNQTISARTSAGNHLPSPAAESSVSAFSYSYCLSYLAGWVHHFVICLLWYCTRFIPPSIRPLVDSPF